MDYAVAMDRLRPGAAYHRADDYATLAAAFADKSRGADKANLGYTMPTDAELRAAFAAWQAEQARPADEKRPDPTGKDSSAAKLLAALDAGKADMADVQAALAHLLRSQ